MASIIKVETLQDTAGNNAVGMQYVANGSAKIWFGAPDQTGHTIAQSLNISGSTDVGTGTWYYAVTNNAASQIDDYAISGTCGWDVNIFRIGANNTTSSQIHVLSADDAGSYIDCPKYMNWCGDLA